MLQSNSLFGADNPTAKLTTLLVMIASILNTVAVQFEMPPMYTALVTAAVAIIGIIVRNVRNAPSLNGPLLILVAYQVVTYLIQSDAIKSPKAAMVLNVLASVLSIQTMFTVPTVDDDEGTEGDEDDEGDFEPDVIKEDLKS